MADIFERSPLRGPAITQADVYNTDGEFSKGVQSGWVGMGSSLRNLAGGVGDAVGAEQFAADQYRQAAELQQEAALRGPRISSLDQLGEAGYTLRNMGDYAAGVMGGALPSVIPAVAAGALAPGVGGALAAGALINAPMEAGDVVGRMRDMSGGAPLSGGDLAQAAGTGLVSSAVQTIPGAIVGGKIAGKAIGNLVGGRPVGTTVGQALKRNAWEPAGEGLSEMAGTAVKQLGSGQALDSKEIIESGVAGAIGGAGLSGVGAVGDYAHGNANRVGDAVGSGLEKAKNALAGAKDASGQALEGVKTSVAPTLESGWDSVRNSAKSAYEGFKESDLGKGLAERAANTRARVEALLGDPDTPSDIKERIQAGATDLGNKAYQMFVAGADKVRETQARIKEDGLRKTFAEEARGVADKIANNEQLGDLKRMATATTEQAQQMMTESATKAKDFAKRMGDDLMKRAMDPDTMAKVQGAMGDLDNAANRAFVAAKWKTFDGRDAVRSKIDDLGMLFKDGVDKVKGKLNSKRSDDYSGVRQIIAGSLKPYMSRINEEAAKDPKMINDLADHLRSYVEAITSDTPDTIDRQFARAKVSSILGDEDAAGLLADIGEKLGVGQDRVKAQQFFAELTELEMLQKGQRSVAELMQRSLPEGSTADVPAMVEKVMAWASSDRAKGTDDAQVQFENTRMMNELERTFGSKSKAILRAVEKTVTQKADMRMPSVEDPRGGDDADRVDEYDGSLSIRDEAQPDTAYYGSGKDRRTLVTDPQVSRAKAPQYESDTERRIKDAQTANPNSRVRFVSLAEKPELLERIPAEKRAVTNEAKRLEAEYPGADAAKYRQQELEKFKAERIATLKKEGKGLIEVSKERNDESLSQDELESMRMDTEKYGGKDAAGRLEVRSNKDGPADHVFDAVRMTAKMMAKINANGTWTKSDTQSQLAMMARAFNDAYAELAMNFGRLRPPDGMRLGDVVIGTLNGKPVTAADAVKADKRPVRERELMERVLSLKDKLNDPDLDPMGRERLDSQLNKLRRDWQNNKYRELSEDGPAPSYADDEAQADGKQDADPAGNISVAGARLNDGDLQNRYNVDGSPREEKGVRSNVTVPQGDLKQMSEGAKRVIVKASDIAEAGGVAEKIADRMVKLAQNIGVMSEADRREFLKLAKVKTPSEAADIVNPLARKYAAQIVPPATKPPAEPKRTEAKEGTPDPKAVAAKKAAFLKRAASGDKDLLKELQSSDDVKALQRALDALVQAGASPAFVDAIDKHLQTLIKDPDAQYAATTRKYSRERVDANRWASRGPSMPVNGKAVLDYIHNVLGDSVQVEFAGILHSGDFTRTDAADIIRISVHSLNPMSVAYHESLHAFFQKLRDKGNQDVANVVMKAVNSPQVVAQLRERLAHSPEALAQLKDPEERAAYAFQFLMSDPTFKLNPEPKGVFEKIAAALRKVLGIWSDSDRALHILRYFSEGKFQERADKRNHAAIYTDLMAPGRNAALETAKGMTAPLGRLADAIVGAGSARLRDSGIPALRQLADIIKRDIDSQGRDLGYIPAARLARTNYLNKLVTTLKGYPAQRINEALEGLQRGVDAEWAEARTIQREVKAYLRELRTYMEKAGVQLGDLGPDYFPRVWDPLYISKNQTAFKNLLDQYGIDHGVMDRIIANDGDQSHEIDRPGNQYARERKLAMISPEDAAQFVQKDFWRTLENYTTQATRRAEWSRRLGDDNSKYDELLAKAREEGATPEQISVAEKYIKGVNGTLGDDLDPSARRLMGNVIVYQNLRLLPLAIFSSIVDPMGIMVRGGTLGDAWNTLKRGVRELPKSWQKDPKFDAEHELAETLGVIDDAMMTDFMSTQYTQGMVDGGAKKLNDLFFKYNFMEGYNRSVRVGATQAAIRFIQRHVTSPNEHSERYLRELGLNSTDIVMHDGKLVVTQADGLGAAQAAAIRRAVNKWVDGAVLRPDAADRPIWMNDPHFALLSHLKGFVFAFHHTILKRVKHEIDNGNYAPAMALAGYVPIMMAADLTKDMLSSGFEEPEWKKGWTLADHVGYGIERAGLLGVGQFAVDAYSDAQRGGVGVGALAGPTVDQFTDAMQVAGGQRSMGEFVLRAMPANSVYREYVSGSDEGSD